MRSNRIHQGCLRTQKPSPHGEGGSPRSGETDEVEIPLRIYSAKSTSSDLATLCLRGLRPVLAENSAPCCFPGARTFPMGKAFGNAMSSIPFHTEFLPRYVQMRSGFFVLAKLNGGRRCSASLSEAKQSQGGKDARSSVWIRWNSVSIAATYKSSTCVCVDMCCLHIPLGIVGLPQQVVYAHPVIIRQLHQQFVRQRLRSRFDVAVFALGNTDRVRDLLLGQVGIIPQILDPVVQ